MSSCAGLPNEVLTKTYQGMTTHQAKELLGEPIETRSVSELTYWKYNVYVPQRGNVPYWFIFEDRKLISWVADEEEYRFQQEQLRKNWDDYDRYWLYRWKYY